MNNNHHHTKNTATNKHENCTVGAIVSVQKHVLGTIMEEGIIALNQGSKALNAEFDFIPYCFECDEEIDALLIY